MNGPSKSDKRGIDWMECGMVFAGVLVVIGLFMESWPEIKRAIAEGRLPNFPVTGGVIVTVGVLLEVVLGVFITQRANRAQSEANERVANAERAAAEANLARMRIEEQLFKQHSLSDEARDELIEILKGYSGRKRAEVFLYDSHLHEVFQLADSIKGAFAMAGWTCGLWIGPEPRMPGTEATFGIARECQNPTERAALQHLGSRLSGILSKLEIRCSSCLSCFSTEDLPVKPLMGWGIWYPKDAAIFRVQIGQRQLASDLLTRPVTPPQA